MGSSVLTTEGYKEITDVIYQGEQNIIKIETQLGPSYCTPEHRLAVLISPEIYAWKQARDLDSNDYLLFNKDTICGSKTKLPEYKNLESNKTKDIIIPELDNDMAWFFGYFHGNGSVYTNKGRGEITVSLPTKYPEIINKVREQCERFGVNVKEYIQGNCHRVKIMNRNIGQYFSQFKQSFSEIETPSFILEGLPEIRMAYLAGLFDSDGTFRQSIKQLHCILSSTCPVFLTQLQSVYSALGIPVRYKMVKKAVKDTHKDLYELHLVGKYSKDLWKNTVGLYSMKYNPIEYKKHTRYEEDYHFPRNWFDNVDTSQNSRYKIISKFMSIDEYKERYDEYPKFIPVRVLGIVKDYKTINTFDITVEGNHEYFCAEGILNHNSAQIAIGDHKDKEFLNAKNWEKGNIPNWRAFSNNSVVVDDINELLDNLEFWKGYEGHGEPYGLINLKLSRTCGRLGDFQYPDHNVVAYNPCFSGDTLIAVADGRKAVSIKQLAKENKDVPVYSIDPETNAISIKWGRNPRITGRDMKLIRVHFGGRNKEEYIDVTPNHEFLTTDGRTILAEDLKKGDSIPQFKKSVLRGYIQVHIPGTTVAEHRMIKQFYSPEEFEENYNEGVLDGCCITGGVVVHHIDEDKTNNSPDNLEITTNREHTIIHNTGSKHSEDTKKKIGAKTKERCEDPEFRKKLSEAQTPEMRERASKRMTEQKFEWDVNNSIEVEQKCKEAGLQSKRLSDTRVVVVKNCEKCKSEFMVEWCRREQAYCSISCANSKPDAIEARRVGKQNTENEKSKKNFHEQVMIYKELQEEYKGKEFSSTIWHSSCAEKGISHRFQNKSNNPYIAKNWGGFKKMANEYNHQVSRIEELDGLHKVYNITVDDNHTLAVITKADKNYNSISGIFSMNCGEQQLHKSETCLKGTCRVHTLEGCFPIKTLVGKNVKIFNGEEWSEVVPFLANPKDTFIKITFSDGSELTATKYHEFSVCRAGTTEFEKLRADQLSLWMTLPQFTLAPCQGKDYLNAYFMGSLYEKFDTSEGLEEDIMSMSPESIREFYKGWKEKFEKHRLNIIFGSEIKLRDLQILLRRINITSRIYQGHTNWVLEETNNHTQSIVKLENLTEEEPSYCFSEPKRHMGVFGNVLTYQCCLSELYLPNISSRDELYKCASYMYRICKHSLTLPCPDSKETEQVVHENMRMGIGITGYMQATEEQKQWLPDCYKFLREYDKNYSILLGFPQSIKLTTVKPSGTLSLLGGCTSGAHPGFAQYYKRRIRIASESQLIKIAKEHGYPVEYVKNFDGSTDHTTQIVTFPCKLPLGTILAENTSAIDQMEWVKRLQTDWSDNSVSVTVYYRKHELPEIKEWLRKNFNNSVKTISFLLHSDHGFIQAPLEQMTKEEYEELASVCKPITNLEGICWVDEKIEDVAQECTRSSCPLR